MPRAVIDTNIWISALMDSSLTRPILGAFIKGKFTPVVSEKLLKEFNDTLSQPKIVKLIQPDEAKELIALINEKSSKIKTKTVITACRDPEDNFLLALLIESKTPLITLDNDLLVLADRFNILPPKEFLKKLK